VPRLAEYRSILPLVAVGVGVVVGSALRNIPFWIAFFIVSPYRVDAGCGNEESGFDCFLLLLPDVIVWFMLFGLAFFAVVAHLTLVGVVAVAIAWRRLLGAPPIVRYKGDGASSRADHIALGMLACGTALIMPALWLAGFIVASAGT